MKQPSELEEATIKNLGKSIVRLFGFTRDALAGLGLLYFCHLAGWVDMTVTSMHIDAAQAEAVAEQVFNGEHVGIITPKKKGK